MSQADTSARPPERYRGDDVALVGRVPTGLRRILLLPAGHGRLGHLLKRSGAQVDGVESRPDMARTAQVLLDAVHENEAALGGTGYDAVIIRDFAGTTCELEKRLERLKPRMADDAWIFVLSARSDTVPEPASGDWVRLGAWNTDQSPDVLALWVGADYTLEAHVARLGTGNRHEAAYEVLMHLPDRLEMSAPDGAQSIRDCHLETLRLQMLLDWLQHNPKDDPVPFFERGMRHFRGALEEGDHPAAAYAAMAGLWERVGAPERGRALLRSWAYYRGEPQHIDAPMPEPVRPETADEPLFFMPEPLPRILFVTPTQPHYGLDVVFHGLCKLLGPGQVVDFPWKPTLHGVRPETFANYPCAFDWPGQAASLDEVVALLRAGHFTSLLWGDCASDLDSGLARHLLDAAQGVPVCLFDAGDEGVNRRPILEARLGLADAGYFKREMLACAEYGNRVVPMPLAYPEERGCAEYPALREQEVFWAGHRKAYLRSLYLDLAERHLGRKLDELFPPEDYAARLRQSRIGLNFFGYGFDTVRYWELPANGCLLFSERPPIRIPHDFKDGAQAVYFDDARDFVDKLTHLREHPEEAEGIARAGHAHFWQHHTATARARQMLSQMRAWKAL